MVEHFFSFLFFRYCNVVAAGFLFVVPPSSVGRGCNGSKDRSGLLMYFGAVHHSETNGALRISLLEDPLAIRMIHGEMVAFMRGWLEGWEAPVSRRRGRHCGFVRAGKWNENWILLA